MFLCITLGKGPGPGLGPHVDPTCPGQPCQSPAPPRVPEQTLAVGAPGMAGSLSSTNAGTFLTQMGRSAAFFPLYFIELVSVSLTYFIIHHLCILGSAGFFGASRFSLGLLSLPILKRLFKRKHVNRSRCQPEPSSSHSPTVMCSQKPPDSCYYSPLCRACNPPSLEAAVGTCRWSYGHLVNRGGTCVRKG